MVDSSNLNIMHLEMAFFSYITDLKWDGIITEDNLMTRGTKELLLRFFETNNLNSSLTSDEIEQLVNLGIRFCLERWGWGQVDSDSRTSNEESFINVNQGPIIEDLNTDHPISYVNDSPLNSDEERFINQAENSPQISFLNSSPLNSDEEAALSSVNAFNHVQQEILNEPVDNDFNSEGIWGNPDFELDLNQIGWGYGRPNHSERETNEYSLRTTTIKVKVSGDKFYISPHLEDHLYKCLRTQCRGTRIIEGSVCMLSISFLPIPNATVRYYFCEDLGKLNIPNHGFKKIYQWKYTDEIGKTILNCPVLDSLTSGRDNKKLLFPVYWNTRDGYISPTYVQSNTTSELTYASNGIEPFIYSSSRRGYILTGIQDSVNCNVCFMIPKGEWGPGEGRNIRLAQDQNQVFDRYSRLGHHHIRSNRNDQNNDH